ncbi:hypothetical protein BDR03DRAFT_834789, partial [Suillus americanus]
RDDVAQATEKDEILLSSEKSHVDQMQELKFYQETPYAIIVNAIDECLSPKEAAGLATLFTEMLSGPDLPIIHLIFTSRPGAHIRATM